MLGKKKKKKKHKPEKKVKPVERKHIKIRKFNTKKLNKLFAILPFVIILILALLYFAPFLSGRKMMHGSDWLLGGYTKRVWTTNYILEHKEIPMWFPHIFGGCPTIGAFFGDLLSPQTLLFFIFPIHIVWAFLFVIYTFLAGIGIYLLLKELKLGFFPSLTGAICYMFSGSLISTTYAGHLGRAISVALLPLMLLFVLKGVKRRKFFYFIFFAGITSLSFLAGHFQMTYYATGLAIFFFVFLLFGERKTSKLKGVLKIVSLFIIGIIVLGMIVSISFLPVYKNLSFGARGQTKGYEYTTSWSLPTAELIDLFVPEYSGILAHYWGENYFKLHSEYFGILPLLLLVVGILFSYKNRNVKFFFFIGLAALFLALGKNTPIFKIAYYIIPGIKKFRAPTLIFYIFTFSAVFVASYGMKRILEKKNRKRLIISLLCFVGFYLVFAFIAVLGQEGFISFLKSHFSYLTLPQSTAKLKAFTDNYPIFIKGIGKALLVSILSFILILLFLKERLKVVYLTSGLLIILLIDQWTIGKKYLKENPPPSEYYKKDEVISFLEKDNSLYRVFPLQYRRSNDGILFINEIQSLGGYHPNPLRRYQELIGAGESVMFQPDNLIRFPKLIDVLNGKYIIGIPLPSDTMRFDERTRASIREWRNYYSRFKPVKQGQYVIYENENFLQRAFFVEDYRVFEVPDTMVKKISEDSLTKLQDAQKDSLLQFMETEEFNPLDMVLLEEEPDTPHPDSILGGSTVSIENYNANRIEIMVKAKTKGFLVLSENYYPRWHCYVDGRKTKVYLADYTLRAVLLDKGEHTVLFVYEDKAYSTGKTFSIIGILILLFSFIFQFFQRKKIKETQSKLCYSNSKKE
ncbi:MAG: hypothetical protein E3J87_00435 [Candidatus Cloacimonadota bacterium]|nr:MAG: hypothetical protein E3J87_00435 [Candidatus Cloacimonadota bacterium]